MKYRTLQKGEIIQAGDETDRCVNPWKDNAVWEPVHAGNYGEPAPDPQFPAHRIFRRPIVAAVCERCDGDGKAHGSDRPFEYSGPDSYPGKCPVCKGSGTV